MKPRRDPSAGLPSATVLLCAPAVMHLSRRQVLTGLAALSCVPSLSFAADTASKATAVVLAPGLRLPFLDAGETGVVAFESADGRRSVVSALERARQAFHPASTFKIPNTIIALETGVVASLDEPVFKWDGQVRTIDGKPVEAWNRDQTLREAFRNSSVWVYQEIARRVGPERMAQLVEALGYGNRRIGEIDRFWLLGPLAITALEQLAFLSRLRAGSLPVAARAQTLTREAMRMDEKDGAIIYGKTGWAFEQKIGWFVGWIERGQESRLFALNLDVAGPASIPARSALVIATARQLGAL